MGGAELIKGFIGQGFADGLWLAILPIVIGKGLFF
jgi:riboflavin biosynthesis pyrimidine reductase